MMTCSDMYILMWLRIFMFIEFNYIYKIRFHVFIECLIILLYRQILKRIKLISIKPKNNNFILDIFIEKLIKVFIQNNQ